MKKETLPLGSVGLEMLSPGELLNNNIAKNWQKSSKKWARTMQGLRKDKLEREGGNGS